MLQSGFISRICSFVREELLAKVASQPRTQASSPYLTSMTGDVTCEIAGED